MENKEEKSCCTGEGKGGCCGGCCCKKALGALVLLLLGGVIGYLIAGHCCGKMMKPCPMGAMSAPLVPPAK